VAALRSALYDSVMQLRRRVGLPVRLAVLGLLWAAAHTFAHALVSGGRGGLHAHHGAGQGAAVDAYAAYLPTSLALCLMAAITAATLTALGRRQAGAPAPSLWFFGFVPVAGFAGHAVAMLPHEAPLPLLLELAPAFAIGLVVQVPFALVAVGIGSRILLVVERVARTLGEPVRLRTASTEPVRFPWPHAACPAKLLAAGAERQRAPPGAFAS
jgi:hypothetical protein